MLPTLASLKDVAAYFRKDSDLTLKDFTAMWGKMSDADKFHIRKGIGDGTYDYDPAESAPVA